MPKKYTFEVSDLEDVDDFQIEVPSNIYVFSKTKSGKSYLLKHLLACLIRADAIDELYIQGTTMEYESDYDDLFPMMTKYNKYINKNTFNLKQLQQVYNKQVEAKKAKKPLKRVVFLLDDIIGSYRANSVEARFISNLCTHCRHIDITLILSVQHIRGILDPTIRNNATNFLFSKITDETIGTVASICNVNKEAIEYITGRLDKYEFCYYANNGERDPEFKIIKVKNLDVKTE